MVTYPETDGADVTKRYLTDDLPGIGGTIKERVEDFVVEELPLYPPCGKGVHTFFEITKTGISTFQAVRMIARALDVSSNRIGYAGLKDAQAITRQILSVEDIPPEIVEGLDLSNIDVRWAKRHSNKLKIGHLRGNRFTIRARGVDRSALGPCRTILGVMARRGVPNRYGSQRFGYRGNSPQLGKAVVRRDAQGFVQEFLGRPHHAENRTVQAARSHFEAGQWPEALQLLPHHMEEERRTLQTLLRSRGDYDRAYAGLPKRLKVFLLSAYQSSLFNQVLAARLETIDRVYLGDLAMKHPRHSIFRVEDEAIEQPRVLRFEISPTGPIFGYKMIQPLGQQGKLEADILSAEHLTLEDFRVGNGIKVRGQRRSLRFQVHEPELWYDEGLMLRFWLQPGSYATVVLDEIMKPSKIQPQHETVTDITKP